MRLRDLKRFAKTLLPSVWITSSRRMPLGIMGMAWLHPDDGQPMIVYAQGLSERERDLTILHELAHHVLGDTHTRVHARQRYLREEWRETRADRWAEQMRELLEA